MTETLGVIALIVLICLGTVMTLFYVGAFIGLMIRRGSK